MKAAPVLIGPRDDDGLLQPSAFPWGGASGGIALPNFSFRAIALRERFACNFDFGRALARAALLELAEAADGFWHQPIEETAAEFMGFSGFCWLTDGFRAWPESSREVVQWGALMELHAFCLAALRGADVAEVIRSHGIAGINADFQAVQVEGRTVGDLWASVPCVPCVPPRADPSEVAR